MAEEIKTKTICENSTCDKGKNLCCHECDDFQKCTDNWKCEHTDFYEQCKKNKKCGEL